MTKVIDGTIMDRVINALRHQHVRDTIEVVSMQSFNGGLVVTYYANHTGRVAVFDADDVSKSLTAFDGSVRCGTPDGLIAGMRVTV